jgi:hypothetical protein
MGAVASALGLVGCFASLPRRPKANLGKVLQDDSAGAAVDAFIGVGAEPEASAAFAIFQLELNAGGWIGIHNCSPLRSDKKQTSPAPARVSGTGAGLVFLAMTCFAIKLVLRCATYTGSAQFGFRASPEIALLVPGFQDASILQNYAEAASEVESIEQLLHGCRQDFGRTHPPAELHKSLSFVLVINEVRMFTFKAKSYKTRMMV